MVAALLLHKFLYSTPFLADFPSFKNHYENYLSRMYNFTNIRLKNKNIY